MIKCDKMYLKVRMSRKSFLLFSNLDEFERNLKTHFGEWKDPHYHYFWNPKKVTFIDKL